MISENEFSNIKLTLESPKTFYYEYENISFDVINYISKNISLLGLYLSYLELNKIEYKVDCRPNNKFYINKCFVHKSLREDYPFSIIDNDGLFVCRGCWKGGHIIDFVGKIYNLQSEEILKILFSYINGTYSELTEKEKNIYDKLFYRYYLKDKYICISKEKTQILDNRIKRYITNSKKEINCFNVARRLGCSSEYVKKIVANQTMQEASKEESKMEMYQFKSFKELISTPVSESEYNQILQMIEEIYNTSFQNQVWMGVILEFLNNNNEGKYYSEYYLNPDFSYGTRRYTYRFISTEEDIPDSITDSDIQVLKRFKAKTPFILYDYEEEPTADIFDYFTQSRTLKKVLDSIGMSEELKVHLCEYCFYQVKQEKQQEIKVESKDRKGFNPDLWQPVVTEHPPASKGYPKHERHEGFIQYQPMSKRYLVPGLLPNKQKIEEQCGPVLTKKPQPRNTGKK